MADRYLLESGSPDGYLLEDGSGVLLLETGVFWDPISGFNKNQFLTLSNSNLTSTSDNQGLWESVRANLPTAVSSFRFEVTLVTGSTPTNILVGVENGLTDFSALNALPGSSNNNGVALQLGGTGWVILRSGGVSQGPFGSPAAASGQIVTVVVDKAAQTVAFLVNGTQIGVNETSVSFTNWYAYVSGKDAATSAGIGNFGASAFSFGTGSAYDGSTSVVSHATTGVLTGPGSTIAGTAAHIAIHTTTGALTGAGSTIAGTAVYNAKHTSTGALTGPGSTIAGSAARTAVHTTTGVLTGQGSVIVGVAVYNAKHTTSGALIGPGSVVVGAAARTRAHATTGVLTGPGSTIAGTAVYNAKHTTSGALTGPGSTVAGTSARFRAHTTSGSVIGPGSTIAGAALRGIISITHATSGALVGQPSIIDGTARRTRQHAASGILTGSPAFIVGVVTRWRDHDSTGALLGVTGVVFGRAFNGTPQLHDIPIGSDNLVNEPSPPAEDIGVITVPGGQIVNHPPYPAA